MTIYSKITENGVAYTDAYLIEINKSLGENNSSSFFSAKFPNMAGRHKSDFAVGHEVIIYADKDVNPATTVIFKGIVEDVRFEGEGMDEKVTIEGRDYSQRLIDATVPPEVYTNQVTSFIANDVVQKYVPSLTRNNIVTTTTNVNQISFKHVPVFDVVKQMAEFSDYIFYVDTNKDVHFEAKSAISSGYTFDNTNTIRAEFTNSERDMVNQIWVYGGKQPVGRRETFTADGAGSVYTLSYNPHNVSVTVSGVYKNVGGISQLNIIPASGTQWLVDYDLKKIIMVSGASAQGLANNIPGSLSTVQVDYVRDMAVVKFGTDRYSINNYGIKEKVIINENITDPRTAKDIVMQNLEQNSQPKIMGVLEVDGVASLTPGNTCVVNLTNQGIVTQTYDIIEVRYEFEKEKMLRNQVLTVKVSQKIKDLYDTLKDIILNQKKADASQINSNDVLTRLEFATGSPHARVSYWAVLTRTLGSVYILGDPTKGVIGQLASQNVLGAFTASYTVQASGSGLS